MSEVGDYVLPVKLADGRITPFTVALTTTVGDYVVPIRLADGRVALIKVDFAVTEDDLAFPVKIADGRVVLVKTTSIEIMCCANQFANYDWTTETWDGPREYYIGIDSCDCYIDYIISCGPGGTTSGWTLYNLTACGGCCGGGAYGEPLASGPLSIYWRYGCGLVLDCDSCYPNQNVPISLPYDGEAPPDSDFKFCLRSSFAQIHWTPTGGFVFDMINCQEKYTCCTGKGTFNSWDFSWCAKIDGVIVYAVWTNSQVVCSANITKAEWDADPHPDCDPSMFNVTYPDVPTDPDICEDWT